MRWMTTLRLRARSLLRGQRVDQELVEELEYHLERLIEDNLAAGMTREEARHRARRDLGPLDPAKEACRDQRGWHWLDAAHQDLGFAARQLTRDPGFTVGVLLVLTLGIGVSHLFLTLTYAHTMRGLPIDAPARVLFLSTVDQRGTTRGVSYLDFVDLRRDQRTFMDVSAFANAPATLGGEHDVPDRFDAAYTSANAFDLAGVRATEGRVISEADQRLDAELVVVLTERVWRGRYERDPHIIGRPVRVNGRHGTVIGVISDRSGFPSAAAILLPIQLQPGLLDSPRDSRTLRVFGRLQEGASAASARADLDQSSEGLGIRFPLTNAGVRTIAVPINERYVGPISGWVPFLLAGVIVVFVASANVGNLLLVRGARRAREVAIRRSLGATRFRVMRQFLIESLALAVAATGLGLGVSRAGLLVYRSWIPSGILPYWNDYSLNTALVWALCGIVAVATSLFALLPAFSASRADLIAVLKRGGRAETGRGDGLAGTGFLALQVGLAVVLVAEVGVNTLNTYAIEVPTDKALGDTHVLTSSVVLAGTVYATPDRQRAFRATIVERFSTVPGVTSVSLASHLPLGGASAGRLLTTEQISSAAGGLPVVWSVNIAPRYFETLGVTIARGREFEPADRDAPERRALVNARLAALYFPGSDPIGQRLAVAPPTGEVEPEWRTIVGLVPDVRQQPNTRPQPLVYLPLDDGPPTTVWVLTRTRADASAWTSPLRDALRQLDDDVPLSSIRTLAAATRDQLWANRVSERFALTVSLAVFLLASVGLYAVIGHRTALRRREIGLRTALGARPAAIATLVVGYVRNGLALGVLLGISGAFAWDRAFAPAPDGGRRLVDPMMLLAVVGTMAFIVALGCAMPTRRAIALAPAEVLRED